ncbi:MAG: RES family NAD+ phosphorylase [Actinomycetota bacterium]|nr:RES family NAD+ phosphorylase [Actinomycetota bacterium]MDA8077100.1 RES family NAD+ phosphorylase [Actinomycetota bacterium]
MPDVAPPADCPGTPVIQSLPEGQALVRIHDQSRHPIAFNPTPRPAPRHREPVRGGRFDSVDGSYASLYAGLSYKAAFAECFGRDLDYSVPGPRPLPRFRWVGKAVTVFVTTRRLRLVHVQGGGAQQLGQDDWLTRCDEDSYPRCRQWAATIRQWAPGADGLTWRSKRDPNEQVVVLWGDPATAETGCGLVSATQATYPLGHGLGKDLLEELLTDTWLDPAARVHTTCSWRPATTPYCPHPSSLGTRAISSAGASPVTARSTDEWSASCHDAGGLPGARRACACRECHSSAVSWTMTAGTGRGER